MDDTIEIDILSFGDFLMMGLIYTPTYAQTHPQTHAAPLFFKKLVVVQRTKKNAPWKYGRVMCNEDVHSHEAGFDHSFNETIPFSFLYFSCHPLMEDSTIKVDSRSREQQIN